MTYLEMVTKDVENVIDDYDVDWTDLVPNIIEKLVDDLLIDDAVTGNGCGEYTGLYSNRDPMYMVGENPDEVREALLDFGVDAKTIGEKFIAGDYAYLDITTRCWILYQAVSDVVEYNVRAMII